MTLPKKALLLFGPTASGKTDIALFLAKNLNAEIINLDSAQIYKELNIGSAKPPIADLQKIPHHLINISSINAPISSFDIFKLTINAINKIQNRYKNVIVTGGTGLYYKTLLYGIFEGPASNPVFRENLQKKPLSVLYQNLQEIDPEAAEKIHPNDYKRIERALEVFESTKIPLTVLQKQNIYIPPCEFLLVGVSYPRTLLYERINKRVETMLENGLLQEVKELYKKGVGLNLLRTIIGYKELIEFVEEKTDLHTAIEKIKQNSRHFAKRQLTLFNNLKGVNWFIPPHNKDILEFVRANL